MHKPHKSQLYFYLLSIHTVLAPSTCFAESFARFGVPITMAQAREPMGLRKDDHIREILKMPEVRKQWIEKHGSEPNEQTVQELYESFVPMQVQYK